MTQQVCLVCGAALSLERLRVLRAGMPVSCRPEHEAEAARIDAASEAAYLEERAHARREAAARAIAVLEDPDASREARDAAFDVLYNYRETRNLPIVQKYLREGA